MTHIGNVGSWETALPALLLPLHVKEAVVRCRDNKAVRCRWLGLKISLLFRDYQRLLRLELSCESQTHAAVEGPLFSPRSRRNKQLLPSGIKLPVGGVRPWERIRLNVFVISLLNYRSEWVVEGKMLCVMLAPSLVHTYVGVASMNYCRLPSKRNIYNDAC